MTIGRVQLVPANLLPIIYLKQDRVNLTIECKGNGLALIKSLSRWTINTMRSRVIRL